MSAMRFVLVIERKHLFPGLSPEGLLPLDAIDLDLVQRHAFFAERDAMEQNSHYKQFIPYIALTRGDRVLAYQRKAKHSEARLGGLWTIGFGGHVEPIDRDAPDAREIGLLQSAALRELHEETGLDIAPDALVPRGYINSEANAVSSVHFGLYFTAELDGLAMSEDEITARVEEQAEPHRVAWIDRGQLGDAPDGGEWENWTQIAVGS